MSITVILSCSSLSLTKPLFLDISLPLDQIFNQQAPGQEIQPQGNAFQSEESINQWDDVTSGMNLETQPQGDAFQPEDSLNQENDVTSGMDQDTQPQGDAFQPEKSIKQDNDVTSGMDAYLDKPFAHNRTARDVSSPCFSHIVRKFDKCRQTFVSHVECLNRHIACHDAIMRYHYPKCETVIGYRQIKFMNKCRPIPVGCQCAA